MIETKTESAPSTETAVKAEVKVESKPEVFNPAIPSGKVSDSLSNAFKKAISGEEKTPSTTEVTSAPEKKAENTEEKIVENTEKINPMDADPKDYSHISTETADGKFKKGESAAAFRMIKQEREEAQRQREEAVKKASDLEIQFKLAQDQIKTMEEKLKLAPTDYDQIKADRDKLNNEIERISFERSETFKRNFEVPLTSAKERIKQAISGTEISEKDIEVILSMQDGPDKEERLNSVFSVLTPAKMTKLGTALAEYERLVDARNQAMENHKQHLSEIEKQNIEAAQTRKVTDAKVLEDVIEIAVKNIPILQEIDGNEDFNTRIKQTLGYARKIWNGEQSDPKTLAEITLAGALLPAYMQELKLMYDAYKEKDEALESVTKELSEIKGASASISATHAPEGKQSESMFQAFRRASGFNQG